MAPVIRKTRSYLRCVRAVRWCSEARGIIVVVKGVGADVVEPEDARATFLPRLATGSFEVIRVLGEHVLLVFADDRIAVRFAYEFHDDSGTWYRAYGNENWEFDAHGLMRVRHASINDLPIREDERKFRWDRSGPRPADHPGLSDLGL